MMLYIVNSILNIYKLKKVAQSGIFRLLYVVYLGADRDRFLREADDRKLDQW